jgi:hypothetical protein
MNSVHNPIPLNFCQPECAEDCPRTVHRVRVPPAEPAGWSASAPGHSGCSASGTGTPPLHRERRGHLLSSVADPGCLYRIPDPDFCPSRIRDPKTATKERGEKNLLSYLFL